MDLVKELLEGNPKAIARAISLIENNSHESQSIVKKLYPYTGKSVILGITGSPGSGKSTLLNQLVGLLRDGEKKIGIIAVDPSSPFSGGAILGDRIRMMRHSSDPDIFIRSMATRGQLGGLARATGEAIAILEASGKEIILVETVGVGQDEVDVVRLADVVLVVLTPGAGDDIQTFKAGVMEIADIFVLNKADTPECDRMVRQIEAMLELGEGQGDIPPIIKTVATTGEGVDSLLEVVNSRVSNIDLHLKESKRKKLISWMLKDIILEKLYQDVTRIISESEFESFIEKIFQRKMDPYTAVEEIIKRLKGN
jgi:LAO/AO transport system kinase